MPRCACASEVYDSRFYVCVCVCVCVCLFRLYITRKLGTGMWNESVSQQYLNFWLAKLWRNGCVLVMCLICSPRWLVGSNPDSCKGYPVYCRLITTLLFHLYHEHDDAQDILITLLSKLSLLQCACYYIKAWPDLPMCSLYYTIHLHTLTPQSDRCLLSL